MEVKAQELLESIKQDNLSNFESIVGNANANYCIGIFPMLSLCYLYKSKKIISKYEDCLISSKNYIQLSAISECYYAFKEHAKRCLRIYAYSTSVVSPLEMLLILGNATRVEKLYKRAAKSEAIKENLSLIQKIKTDEDIEVSETIITIPKQPLTNKMKKMILGIISAFVVTLIFISLFTYFSYSYGLGTEQAPIQISSPAQFAKVIKSDYRCILKNDITISSINLDDFDGTIDGAGHTITITNQSDEPVIGTLTGCIKNVNFKFNDMTISTDVDYSLFVDTNKGQISNVSIECNLTLNITGNQTTNTALYTTGGVLINNSSINNIKYVGDVIIHGSQTVNSYFALITCSNNGTINNCSTLNSTITAENSDVVGIVIENGKNSVIANSINNSDIVLTSGSQWSPGASGIALSNVGAIKSCTNNGNINIVSNITDENIVTICIGGIAFQNIGNIESCKNTGNFIVQYNKANAYIGGILGINDYSNAYSSTGNVTNCAATGTICVTSTNSGLGLLGGCIGYNNGYLKNSYSSSTINYTGGDNTSAIGGLIGANTGIVYSNMISDSQTKYISNNAYLKTSTINIGAAAYSSGTSFWVSDREVVEMQGFDTIEELTNWGLYW